MDNINGFPLCTFYQYSQLRPSFESEKTKNRQMELMQVSFLAGMGKPTIKMQHFFILCYMFWLIYRGKKLRTKICHAR